MFKKPVFRVVALVFVLALVGSIAYGLFNRDVLKGEENSSQAEEYSPPERAAVGFTAPRWLLNTVDGSRGGVGDYRGKVTLMTFWRISCPACRAEMPFVQELYSELPADVAIVMVNIMDSQNLVKEFMNENGYTFPVYLDSRGAVANLYMVTAIPTTYAIDAKGIIREVKVGLMDRKGMEALIERVRRFGK